MSPPEILLGSGVWGHFVNEDEIHKQIAVAGEFGILHIDSGAHHPYSKPGLAEVLLGKARFKGMIVDSKVLYVNGGDGTLTAEAVRDSIDTTLASLKIEKLHTYYALAPDRTTPLAD